MPDGSMSFELIPMCDTRQGPFVRPARVFGPCLFTALGWDAQAKLACREALCRDQDAAAEFLANMRIAVTGVSKNPKAHGSNVVYRWLRDRGYKVFAVNPNATDVEGDHCYPDLRFPAVWTPW